MDGTALQDKPHSDTQREAVIRVRNLTNQFGEQVVHDNLNLDVWRGEVLGVVGGSGTGKSVLLRTIVGLNKPKAGSIEVLGSRCPERPGGKTGSGSKKAGVWRFRMAPCFHR